MLMSDFLVSGMVNQEKNKSTDSNLVWKTDFAELFNTIYIPRSVKKVWSH